MVCEASSRMLIGKDWGSSPALNLWVSYDVMTAVLKVMTSALRSAQTLIARCIIVSDPNYIEHINTGF